MPAICIDARHAKAALDMAANKTDANDADGLACGFHKFPDKVFSNSRTRISVNTGQRFQ
jgi:hypothetical protein